MHTLTCRPFPRSLALSLTHTDSLPQAIHLFPEQGHQSEQAGVGPVQDSGAPQGSHLTLPPQSCLQLTQPAGPAGAGPGALTDLCKDMSYLSLHVRWISAVQRGLLLGHQKVRKGLMEERGLGYDPIKGPSVDPLLPLGVWGSGSLHIGSFHRQAISNHLCPRV